MRRLARWAGRLALGAAVLLGLGLAFLQTPPGRNLLRSSVLGFLRRAGLEARLQGIEARPRSPSRWEIRVAGLELARPGHPPFLALAEGRAQVSPAILRGRPGLKHLETTSLLLTFVRDATGEWNLPPGESRGPAPPPDLRPWLDASISLDRTRVEVRDAAGDFEVKAPEMRFSWAGSAARGSIEVGPGVDWRSGERRGHVAVSDMSLESDGGALRATGLRLTAPEGRLELRATLVPLQAPGLKLDATGHAEVAALLGPPGRGRVGFHVSAEGPFDELSLDFDAAGDRLTYGDLAVGAAARGRVEAAQVTLETRLDAAGGWLKAAARMPRGATPTPNIVNASWEGFDPATLVRTFAPLQTPFPLAGRIAGTLEARWEGENWRQASVDAKARVAPPTAAGGRLPWAGVSTLEVRRRAYVLDLEHHFGGAATLAGRLQGTLDPDRLASTSVRGPLRLAVAEPRELLSALAPSGQLPVVEGRLEAEITLDGILASPRAVGDARFLGLRVAGSPPMDGEARLDVANAGLKAEPIEIRTAWGALARGGLAIAGDGGLSGRLEGRLARLEAWAPVLPRGWSPVGEIGFSVSLSGTTTLPVVEATLEGTRITLLGQPPLRRLEAQVTATRTAVELPRLVLEQDEGRFEGSGRFALDGQRLSLRATARDFRLSPIPAGALAEQGFPVQARVVGNVDVRVDGPQAEANGRLELLDLRFSDRPLGDAMLELVPASGALGVALRLPALGAEAEGRLAPAAPHQLTGELRLREADLAALARAAGIEGDPLAGSVTLRAGIDGEGSRLAESAVEIDLASLQGVVLDLPFRLLAPAKLALSPDRLGVTRFELDLGGGRLTAGGALTASGDDALEARWSARLETLAPLLKAVGGDVAHVEGDAELHVRASGTPADPQPEATLRVSDTSIRQRGLWPLRDVRLEARYADGALQVDRFEGRARRYRFELTGRAGGGLVPREAVPAPFRGWLGGDSLGQARLAVTSEGRRPEAVGDEPLHVTATLETDGPGRDRLRGQAHIEALALELQGAELQPEHPFDLDLRDGRITMPTVSWRGGSNDLRVGGSLRLPPAGTPLGESAVEATAAGILDLRVLSALGRGVEGGGLATLEARLRGPVREPKVEGSLRFEGAVLRHRPYRLFLDDLSGTIRATNGALALESFTGTLNGGTLEAKGELQLGGLEPRGGSVALSVAGAALDWPPGFRGAFDSALELRGTPGGLVLGGTVSLLSGAYKGDPTTLAGGGEASLAPDEQPPSPLPLGLDLRLHTEQEVHVGNPFGVFAFSFDVYVTGSASDPRLKGQLALARGGYVFWSGRRFTLERALLDWNPASGLDPFVQARATSRVSSYFVTADISGPLTRADTHLASDPPLSQNEITSLLVTGSTRGSTADARALGIVSANFLGNFGHHAGLDSVRIEGGEETSLLSFDPTTIASEANPTQRLTVTKRLSHNLEATVSLNLSESGKTTTFVGWKPIPALEVRVAQRDDYTGSLELRHDLAFGGGGTKAPPGSERPSRRETVQETVRSVDIEDDAEGRAPALRVDLALRPGKRFRYEEWQADRDRLEEEAGRQGFAEAYVVARREPRSPPEGESRAEVALRYAVRRGPRTALLVEGVDDETLRRRILLAWSRGDFEAAIEDETEALVRERLARRGYFAPRITAKTVFSPDQAAKSLLVRVEPGPRESRRRVDFQGVNGISLARLQNLVKGRTREDEAFAERRRLGAAVRTLYRQEGYLAVAVRVRRPVLENDEAVLRVEIEEGPLFRRGRVEVAGCAEVPCAELKASLALAEEAPYREEEVEAARNRVLSLYRQRGFAGAQVAFAGRIDPEAARVDVALTVKEGPRRVLQEVVVAGADPATRRALEPLVTLRPGEPVVPERWAEVRRRLYETGLVRGVSLEPETLGSPGGVDGAPAIPGPAAEEPVRARLTYDAWPALRLRYGLQLVTEEPITSSGDQAVDLGGTVELTRATLLGRALSSALSAEVRPDTWNVRGVLSAPRTFGRSLRSSLFLVRELSRTEIVLERDAAAVPAEADTWELTLEERVRRGKLELALSYDIQWLTLRVPQTRLAEIALRPARLIGTVLMDGRSNILDPRKGYFSSLSFEYGAEFLGSQFDFTRLFTQNFGYLPLPSGLLFATGVRYEWASGQGQAYLSTQRLGIGGATTVRGYENNSLELINLLSFFGATTHVLVLNEELRFPLWRDLRGVAFLDYGRLWAGLSEGSGTEYRLGAGGGLRYSTPVGVLRFDVAFPLRGQERTTRYYFGLGQAF